MSKYRIVQNIVTKEYKVQQRIFYFWWLNVWDMRILSKEYAEYLLDRIIRSDENHKKSNWKEV